MSWYFNQVGKKGSVRALVMANETLPEHIKTFMAASIDRIQDPGPGAAYDATAGVHITGSGHLGQCAITITPVGMPPEPTAPDEKESAPPAGFTHSDAGLPEPTPPPKDVPAAPETVDGGCQCSPGVDTPPTAP